MRKTILSAAVLGLSLMTVPMAWAQDDDTTCDEATAAVAVLDVQVNDAISADRAVEAAEKVAADLADARAELAAAVAADNATVPPLTEDSQRTVDAKERVAELEEEVTPPADLARLRERAAEADAGELIRLRVLAIAERDEACDPPTPPTTTPPPTTPPPFVDFDCADFPLPDGRTAAQVLDETPGADPHNLDSDGDRVPCEVGQDTAPADDEQAAPSTGGIEVPTGRIDTGGGPA